MSAEVASAAHISPDGRFRWSLSRTWGDAEPLVWLMLNPSTADAESDDPTIRRCMGFARDRGYGGIVVVNLFAYRATKPSDLVDAFRAGWIDAVDMDVNRASVGVAAAQRDVVAAWGAHPITRQVRHGIDVRDDARNVWCLGRTKDGYPRHPLYVKADQPFEVYP